MVAQFLEHTGKHLAVRLQKVDFTVCKYQLEKKRRVPGWLSQQSMLLLIFES